MSPNTPVPTPIIDLSFPHRWKAEILSARPFILPPRHFVYPQQAEEVERGALEVLIRPMRRNSGNGETAEVSDLESPSSAQDPFLATCALGFRDPAVPTGLWSTPKPEEICAVAGGYAYILDTRRPEHFTMIEYRPVLDVRPAVASGLLLFVGHRSILAWGMQGVAWETAKLSDEGVKLTSVDENVARGLGWNLMTDNESPFAVDLRNGQILRD